MSRTVRFTHEIEELGITLDVSATFDDYTPAHTSGSNDTNHPSEGGEIEDISIRMENEHGGVDIEPALLDHIYTRVDQPHLKWSGNVLMNYLGAPVSSKEQQLYHSDVKKGDTIQGTHYQRAYKIVSVYEQLVSLAANQ